MKTTKKALALFMSLVMLISALSAGFAFNAGAAYNCDHNIDTETSTLVVYHRIPATCESTGKIFYDCVECDFTTSVDSPVDPDYHTLGSWNITVEPTCDKAGEKERYCTNPNCDFVEIIEEPATGSHRYASKSVLDFWWQSGAQVGDVYEGWIIESIPDCFNTGLARTACLDCGGAEITAPIALHSATFKQLSLTESDCLRTGACEVVCTLCNANFTLTVPVNPQAHLWKWETVTEPTCTEEGVQKGHCLWHPSVVNSETQSIAATGHSFTSYTTNNDATCNKNGTKTAKCDNANCNAEDTVEDIGTRKQCATKWIITEGNCVDGGKAKLECLYADCSVDYSEECTFAAGEHVNIRTFVVAATCTQGGYKYNYCIDCGYNEVIKGSETEKAGHEYSWTTVITPNCIAERNGKDVGTCTKCGDVQEKEIPYTHNYIVLVSQVYPTCTKEGVTARQRCVDCNYVEEPVSVPPTGHKDTDNNGNCNVCYVYFVQNEDGTTVDCKCFCHSSEGLAGILFKVYNFLCRILGINQMCECGKVHYEKNGILK